jgi:hypothetical protein
VDKTLVELSVLCILACACFVAAWTVSHPLFVAVFAAEAVWALSEALYLSPPD